MSFRFNNLWILWACIFIQSQSVLAAVMNPELADYPNAGHWPYGPSSTSETWSDGTGNNILYYGAGTVLQVAKASGVLGIEPLSEVKTHYAVKHIDVLSDGGMVAVSDNNKWVTLIDTQAVNNPFILGRYAIEDGRWPTGVKFVDQNLLMVAVAPAGLWALDISDPASITLAGNYIEAGTDQVSDVEVLGDYAFLADDVEGVSAIDIRDPTNMFLSNRFSAATSAIHLSIYENTAYVSRGNQGLSVLKLNVNNTPVLFTDLGTVDPSLMPEGFGFFRRSEKAENDLIVVSDAISGNGLVLIDTANMAAPVVIGGTHAPNMGLSVLGNYAYSSPPSWYSNHGMYAFDLNDTTGGVNNPPVEIDYLPLVTESINVDVDSDIITLTSGNSGVVLIDASSPAEPVTSSWLNQLGNGAVNAAVKINDVLAIANYESELKLVDVTDIEKPVVLPELDFGNGHIVQHVEKTTNNSVVVAAGPQGVKWVDLSDPMVPLILGSWTESNNANITRLIVSDDTVFAFSGSAGWVIDFTNKAAPVELDSFSLTRTITDADVEGDYLYLANDFDGLRIWDISDPSNAEEVGEFSTLPTFANGVSVHNNMAYIAADTFYGMLVVDVSNPASPQHVTTIETPGKGLKVEATDDFLVLADADSGVRIWSKRSDVIFVDGFDH